MIPRRFSAWCAPGAAAFFTACLLVQGADWPQFRGPAGLGVAAEDARPPLHFDPGRNVAWKQAVPGGNSSPVIRGDRLFLTASADGKLLTLAFDAETGRELWRQAIAAEAVEESRVGDARRG